MNAESFKQKQQLFQRASKNNIPPPRPKVVFPVKKTDASSPKTKDNNNNNNNNNINTQPNKDNEKKNNPNTLTQTDHRQRYINVQAIKRNSAQLGMMDLNFLKELTNKNEQKKHLGCNRSQKDIKKGTKGEKLYDNIKEKPFYSPRKKEKRNSKLSIFSDKESNDNYSFINNGKKTLANLEVDNFKNFNEEDYSERKYDSTTIDKGKLFFKYRYLKNKYTQINETIKRLSNVNKDQIINLTKNINDKRLSMVNSTGLNINSINNINNLNSPSKIRDINSPRGSVNPIDNRFKLSNNVHLSFFIQNPSTQCLNSIDKDSELRHNHSQFLKITEKSILCFNLKKYEESYLFLYTNNIIKSKEEFGEFLLVVNGFDKFIIGDFLSGDHAPNEKKEVLKAFINGIKMDYKEINFIECFRFFMKRLYLPKDANLILVIMNTFSELYFENNKHYEYFVLTFKNINNIYLLISTLLAVNTMFTRKDIKRINIIKKDEFVSMNKDIPEAMIMNIYDELAKNPLSIDSENYNENIYKRMSTLAKEKISSSIKNNNTISRARTFNPEEESDLNKIEENLNFTINEEDSDEEYDSNTQDSRAASNHNIGNRSIMRSSFSLTKNLYSFTKQDQDILQKSTKFYKFVEKGALHEREFAVYDNFTKLIWGKTVDTSKVKGNLHFILIADIIDVFNGIEHSESIKKYVKANPKESKEKNCFITIISNKRKISLKSNSLQTALLWYKALKSLVLKKKNENIKRNSKTLNEKNIQFKSQLEELWKDFILPKWNIYGNYILTKLKKRNELLDKKESNNSKNKDTILKEVENDKNLDYYDFLQFFYLGVPAFCRGTVWRLLIGNPCSITETLYENYLANVETENFNTFDTQYHEDINTIFNVEFNINQMITDIIKAKDFFLADLIQLKIDQDQIMNKSYNILRIFYLMRSDLIYKKSIVPLIFVFLMVDENEYHAFCNIYNLICNSDIINYYIGNEDYIKKNVDFFSKLVKKYLPRIHEHFNNLGIAHELYFIPWICEIYSSNMSYKLLVRILDLYLLNGPYLLFQIGISILGIQQHYLLDLTISEILKLLKKLSSKFSEDSFLEKMKTYNSIKDDYNKWRKEDELVSQKLQLFQAIFNDDEDEEEEEE